MIPHDFTLKILGPRGSMPVHGPQYSVFGGSTSCYLVEAGEETIFLDGGTGLLSAPSDFPTSPHILLSHLHLDHVLGLGVFPRLLQEGCETTLHLPGYNSPEDSNPLDQLFTPPFWPLRLADYRGDLRMEPLFSPFRIGDVTVETLPCRHPGGCLNFRLSYGGRRLIYATDVELAEEDDLTSLAEFAREADLILLDAQYSSAQYPARKGFGHSTEEMAIRVMEMSHALQMRLIHHDPQSTDAILLEREAGLPYDAIRFAREGEELAL